MDYIVFYKYIDVYSIMYSHILYIINQSFLQAVEAMGAPCRRAPGPIFIKVFMKFHQYINQLMISVYYPHQFTSASDPDIPHDGNRVSCFVSFHPFFPVFFLRTWWAPAPGQLLLWAGEADFAMDFA